MAPKKTDEQDMHKASLALAIPGLLFAGPIVGWLLGEWLQRLTGWGDWMVFAGILLGIFSGGYETWRIIRRIS